MILPPGDIMPHLQTFLVVTTEGSYWCLVGRDWDASNILQCTGCPHSGHPAPKSSAHGGKTGPIGTSSPLQPNVTPWDLQTQPIALPETEMVLISHRSALIGTSLTSSR